MSEFCSLRRSVIAYKRIVAAIEPLNGVVQYSAAKHGVLGLQRSISAICTAKGIRSGSVHPWFVGKVFSSGYVVSLSYAFTDTALISSKTFVKLLDGVKRVPMHLVAATCLAVATNPDPETSERPWVLMPNGDVTVERLHDIGFRDADMELVNMRLRAMIQAESGGKATE